MLPSRATSKPAITPWPARADNFAVSSLLMTSDAISSANSLPPAHSMAAKARFNITRLRNCPTGAPYNVASWRTIRLLRQTTNNISISANGITATARLVSVPARQIIAVACLSSGSSTIVSSSCSFSRSRCWGCAAFCHCCAVLCRAGVAGNCLIMSWHNASASPYWTLWAIRAALRCQWLFCCSRRHSRHSRHNSQSATTSTAALSKLKIAPLTGCCCQLTTTASSHCQHPSTSRLNSASQINLLNTAGLAATGAITATGSLCQSAESNSARAFKTGFAGSGLCSLTLKN